MTPVKTIPGARIELARPRGRGILSPSRGSNEINDLGRFHSAESANTVQPCTALSGSLATPDATPSRSGPSPYTTLRHLSPEDYAKKQAMWAVNGAIKLGKMKRGTVCARAGKDCKGRIEGHHPDYSRPLHVIWLCAGHHHRLHAEQRRGAR